MLCYSKQGEAFMRIGPLGFLCSLQSDKTDVGTFETEKVSRVLVASSGFSCKCVLYYPSNQMRKLPSHFQVKAINMLFAFCLTFIHLHDPVLIQETNVYIDENSTNDTSVVHLIDKMQTMFNLNIIWIAFCQFSVDILSGLFFNI